ncbi:MAG TPA: amino acid racemase [Candidatus Eisenbacteria bacterium]|jgi:aspartate racemase
MKTLGIVAHSAEGGALCYLTVCREGQKRLGPHMHPEIVVSSIPMGSSMPGWESGEHDTIARVLTRGVEQVARAGAGFFICPDNTAHIVLERIADSFPIPGLHIADVVCAELGRCGWKAPGLLGTRLTMTGTVYANRLRGRGHGLLIPDEKRRDAIDHAIFDELCQGVFRPATTDLFVRAIDDLRAAGADCVILGCTEIPLIVSEENSPLPVLDSTRLLAKHAVSEAIDDRPLPPGAAWISRSEWTEPSARS